MSIKAKDSGDGRKYFSQIPNIICMLGLSPFELALYVHLKKTAGAEGECTKSTPTLAKETGMSVGMVSKAKEGLQRTRIELNNKPLITITEEPNPHGGKPRHLITLTDIWTENITHCSSSYSERAISPHELASSPDEIAISPHEIKKIDHQEDSKDKTQHSKKQSVAAPARRSTVGKDSTLNHLAVKTYRDHCHLTPNHDQRRLIIDTIGESESALATWAIICAAFMHEGRPPTRVDWLIERYTKARGQPKGPEFRLTPEIFAGMEGISIEEAKRRLEQ